LAWQQKTQKNRNRQKDSLNLVYSSQLNTVFHTIEGVDENPSKQEYIPFLTVVSNNFEKDLPIVKNMLAASKKRLVRKMASS
jgi:transposase